ncbi:MAG: chain-length determining protein [Acidaminococcaceae bacterium]|nr:chain-length determining protein [Acidaminococcaceae bacterium]
MEDQEYTIDLMEVADIIIDNRKPIAKITGSFIILAILYLLIAAPVYESEALLRIKQQQGLGSSLLDAATGGNEQMSQQQMSTMAEILKSRGVVVPVIEATEEQKDGKYPQYETYVDSHITTAPFKNTEILQLKMKGKSPELAQKANKLLVDSFLKRITMLSRTEQTATKGFLDERVKEAKEDLDKAETALQNYKTENRIISPTDSAKVFTDRIADVEKQAAANQVALEAAQAKLNAINGQLGGSGAASADNRTIQQYNTELAKLEAERISYVDKYTEKHPRMIELNDQIASLKQKIQQEINKVAALQAPSDNGVHQSLVAGKYQSEGEIAVAQQKAAALQQIINQNNADLEKLPEVEKGYVKVARDAQVANEIYVMLAKRLEESKVAEVMQPNNVQVVDEPTLPERPISPRKGRTLALAALLGLLLSSGFTVAMELMNRTISTEDDVKNYLALPVMGAIPDETSMSRAMTKQKEMEAKEPGFMSKVRDYVWKK